MQVEEKNYLREQIKWSRSLDAEFPYQTVHDGNRLRVRVNDFPEQNFYTLIVNDNEVADFNDWPVNWIRTEDVENSHQETSERRQIKSQSIRSGRDFLPSVRPASRHESSEQGDATRPEMPPIEKITVDWLMKHVPFRLWASFAALLLGAFVAGVTAGQLSFVRELVSRAEEKKIQPMPSPVSPTPGPSLLAAKIEIRSPVNGDHVSGETTFGASVIDLPLSHYKMFWQVDNGQLNPMVDSNESGPHKEAKVNVSGWNWKGKGAYAITFVAEDSKGSRIAERSVNIFVDPK